MSNYVELHCLSCYSFLRSASHPSELVARAAALGYNALAVTDECSLSGIVKAHVAAKEYGIKLIVGSEFSLVEGIKLVALAPSRAAYGELSGLISMARRRSPKGEYRAGLRDVIFHLKRCLLIWLPEDDDEASRGWFSGDMFGISYTFLRLASGNFVLPATTPTQFDPALFVESVELLEHYHPQRMYLTHYGELPYGTAVKQLLLTQVAAYRDLAPAYAGDHQAMRSAVLECTLDALRPLTADGDVESYRDRLAMDAELNAQGLEIWLQKQAVVVAPAAGEQSVTSG